MSDLINRLTNRLARDASRLVSSQAAWYVVTLGTAATLQLLPIIQPNAWKGDVKQGLNFGAAAACLTVAGLTAGKVERDITELRVRNQMGHQYSIDEMVDCVNLRRAATAAQIRLLNGAFTQGEIQQQMGEMMLALKGETIHQAQLPAASEILPVEDLAQTIADNAGDENNVLFVGKSRCGKTSLLLNAIDRKNAKHDGDVDWYVFNGKPERDNNWGGLRNSPNDYWNVNSQEKAIDMLNQFKACVRTLQDWQLSDEPHYPIFIVADELNNQYTMLKGVKNAVDDLKGNISLYATQCMSEGSGLWISTHSHYVEDININRNLQNSFQLVALGRNGKYESIEAVLDDAKVIKSSDLRERLKAQLNSYIESGEKGSIAFTNLGGESRLVKLPYYSKDVTIKRTALNQSTNEILDSDVDLEESPKPINHIALLERLYQQNASHPVEDLEQELVSFFTEQEANQPSAGELTTRQRKLLEYCRGKGWLSPSKIKAGIRAYRDVSDEEILADWNALCDAGYGSVQSNRNTWNFKID